MILKARNPLRRVAAFGGRAVQTLLHQPGEIILLLRMAFWVVAVTILMKRLPMPRVLQIVTPRRSRSATAESVNANRRAQILDWLLSRNILCFTPTCWKRAPVLYRYLALSGIQTCIVFGVRPSTGEKLDGHAWLEKDGKAILEKTLPDYVVTYSFP